MEVIVDYDRAELVLGRLMNRYLYNGYPFYLPTTLAPQDSIDLPDEVRTDPEAYAYFLFCLCFFMSATDSNTVAIALTRLYHERREFFDPHYSANLDVNDLAAVLREVGLGFDESVRAAWWQTDARRLCERWGGSVLKLIDGITDYDEACERLLKRGKYHGFLGFQHKMVSMLLYYLVAEKLMPEFNFPVPVDLHIQRITLANEIVRVPDVPMGTNLYKEVVLKAIRQLTVDYQLEHGLTAVDLSNTMWLYAKAMCRHNPGNKTLTIGPQLARSTQQAAHIVTWTEAELRSYIRSCGSCALRDTCRYNIPAGPYYRKGQLILRSLREEPPPELLGLYDSHQLGYPAPKKPPLPARPIKFVMDHTEALF